MKLLSLIGFMGCGKSSVGRRLSQLLCCPFIDLDEVIVERAGKSIPEIFADDGEKAFRQMELEALRGIVGSHGQNRLPKQSLPSQAMGPSLCGQRGSTVPEAYSDHHTHALSPDSTEVNATESNAKEKLVVLALGGGTVMTPECAEIVSSETRCIYLRASVETLIGNLEGQTANRPLLNLQNCHSDLDSNCHSDQNSNCHFERDSNCHSDRDSNCHFERAKRVEKSISLKSHIESLLVKRSATYEKTAHIIIDTDGKSIETIASEIISTL